MIMKTNIMSKEQAQNIVRNTKYTLRSKNESANLQKKLFEIGCRWICGCEEVQYEYNKYLFVDNSLYITTSNANDLFMENKKKKLQANDVLSIEIKDMEMETTEKKEMTKEKALEFLKNTKILCTSKAETIQVQVKLFQFGIEWISKTKGICEDKYLLFINEKQELQHSSDIEYWMEDVHRRIEPSEILAIKLKEEKPKFDPSTLQAFDKVLVRDDENEEWSCNLYSHLITSEHKYKYKCIYDPYVMCIPYNDDTKHLLGTKNKAPEFYRI